MTSGQKILLVEDDEALRTSLSEQLNLHGEFEIHTATTGAEALDAGKTGHFGLIILDVGLPDLPAWINVKCCAGYRGEETPHNCW